MFNRFSMKRLFILFILSFLVFSCKDEDEIRKEEAQRAAQKQSEIFKAISESWKFKPADFSEEAYSIVQQWAEWNMFYNELLQKPQTNISAFQRKSKMLVNYSEALESTIPEVFNIPQVQSRFEVLDTKLKLLKTYITLDDIPTEKVIKTVKEINIEVESVVSRMKTILEKNKIQREEGETELLESIKKPEEIQAP